MEIWRDIKGYEGLYQVSNHGRVKSFNYLRKGETELLKPGKSYGYNVVCLCIDGVHKMKKVHRLVAEAFLPKPDGKDFINHKIEGEEGKTINIVEFNDDGTIDYERTTIEWCDQKYNNTYGTVKKRQAKKLFKPVFQYTLSGELVKKWPSASAVQKEFGWFSTAIGACCRGKMKTSYNHIWRYA